MNFDIVRSNSVYKRFVKDVRNNKVSHAYLVCGEDDDLRDSFFLLASMLLRCKTACGECAACRKVLEGNDVDITKLNGKDKITVSDIKGIIENIYVKSAEDTKKILIIDNAEELSLQAQNKLLKTYEEPPEYLTVFLGVKHENSLIATLRSRGKKLYTEDVPSEVIANELESNGTEREIAVAASALAMGNYSKAVSFCEEKEYGELYDKTFLMMAELKKSQQVPEYVYGGCFEKNTVKTTLDFMEIILCDIMKKASGSNAELTTVNRDYDLNRAGENHTAQSAALSIEAVNLARERLSANMGSQSVACGLLLSILETKYKYGKKTK